MAYSTNNSASGYLCCWHHYFGELFFDIVVYSPPVSELCGWWGTCNWNPAPLLDWVILAITTGPLSLLLLSESSFFRHCTTVLASSLLVWNPLTHCEDWWNNNKSNKFITFIYNLGNLAFEQYQFAYLQMGLTEVLSSLLAYHVI